MTMELAEKFEINFTFRILTGLGTLGWLAQWVKYEDSSLQLRS